MDWRSSDGGCEVTNNSVDDVLDPFEGIKDALRAHLAEIDTTLDVVDSIKGHVGLLRKLSHSLGIGDDVEPLLREIAELFAERFRGFTYRIPKVDPLGILDQRTYIEGRAHPIARKILSWIPALVDDHPGLSFAEAMEIIYLGNQESKAPDPIIRRFKATDGSVRLLRLSEEVSEGHLNKATFLYGYLKEAGEFLYRFANTPAEQRHTTNSLHKWAYALEVYAEVIFATLRRWGVELEFGE